MSARHPTTSTLRFRILAATDVDEIFIARWRALSEHAIEPNPYLDPRFLVPSVQHREDARELQLAVVEDGDTLLAVLAFTTGRWSARVPVATLTTAGSFMAIVCDLFCYPLMSPSNPVATWACLLGGLHKVDLPGLLELHNFPGEGLLVESLRAAAARMKTPILEQGQGEHAFASKPVTDRVETALQARSSLAVEHVGSNGSQRWRRRISAIEQVVMTELRVINLGDDPEAIEKFIELEASGWKGDQSHGGHSLLVANMDRWFVDVATAFRADGGLVVFALVGGDRVLYMDVIFRVAGGLFGCLDAYDESFSKHSVGTLGRNLGWKYGLTLSGVEFYDPNLHPSAVESTRVYPGRRPHVSLMLAHGGLFTRTMVRAVPTARRLRGLLGPVMSHFSR